MASDALGAQDALEMRAVIQSLVDVIMVKREQQAAFRKQFAWPCLCHSMLWSAGLSLDCLVGQMMQDLTMRLAKRTSCSPTPRC